MERKKRGTLQIISKIKNIINIFEVYYVNSEVKN